MGTLTALPMMISPSGGEVVADVALEVSTVLSVVVPDAAVTCQ